ncbi:hypothetical protein AB0O82_32565 [Kitasatospora sp. NPDC088264]|uniref:hypothetical protein n=1 Tax=Kitasatospora sp. NPDC088264 TaxID=3155296 RepID=UPI00344A17F2
MPKLHFTPAAARTLKCLERGRRPDRSRLQRVRRALDRLAADPRHPGLRTHPYRVLPGHTTSKVWDSYVDQGPNAWRIYWTYGPAGTGSPSGSEAVLTVLVIGPHP